MKRVALACVLAFAAAASAQDYERESRWADEVMASLVVGDAVRIVAPNGREFLALYTPAVAAKPAILLVHGLGVHPDHGVIGILRMALADMGYTTLSIQMPVLAAGAAGEDYYPKLFPGAAARIAAAARWLAGRGHAKAVLLSHSMGSWMSDYYFETAKEPPFAAWVSLGRSGALHSPRRLPVLDVYGENDLPSVLSSAAARRGARQVRIKGADHFYTGKESELAAQIRKFVEALR